MTDRGVGGAARRGTPRGAGSSPADPTILMKLSAKEIRNRIRKVDRKLSDTLGGEAGFKKYWPTDYKKLDGKRRALRVAIKAKAALRKRI
jgi:hypothetical protein